MIRNMNTSSRTGLRLQLMREQSMNEQNKGGSKDSFGSISPASSAEANTGASSPLAMKVSASNAAVMGSCESVKTSPIIISQPIRFTGNRLVHLPPQIIHVQKQQIGTQEDAMGRKNVILSSSLPPGLPQGTPPKSGMYPRSNRVTTPLQHPMGQNYSRQHKQQEHRSSKQSPSELSPGAGGCESPSASFASAQSELDDIIIDEILSMEEEQRRHVDVDSGNSKMPNSMSYASNLEGFLIGGRLPYNRQVSSSAPTSTLDIEGLIREEMAEEQEIMRERRKKDIHNMIERRRRYNINDRIKELGTLLPKGCTEEMKLNKGTILRASVEYIRALKRDQDKLYQLLQRYQNAEQNNRHLIIRIRELEEQLAGHGVPIPPADQSFVSLMSGDGDVGTGMTDRRTETIILSRRIKTEPLDEEQTPQPTPQPVPDHSTPCFGAPANNQQEEQCAPPMQTETGGRGRSMDCMGGHSYAISSVYSSAIDATGVLETPPVVNNNLSLFGQPRHQQPQQDECGHHHHHQQQQQQLVHDLMMDLGGDVNGGTVVGGNPSTAALVSSADPLMSDCGLINSQVASPEIQWEAQAFSPETAEQMDFTAP